MLQESVNFTTLWVTKPFPAEKLLALDGIGEVVFLRDGTTEKLLMVQCKTLLHV